MRGLERAHGAGLRPHHERGCERAAGAIADAAEQIAVSHAGGGEEDVLAADQVVRGEDALEVVAGVAGGLRLLLIAGPEPALELTAEALDPRRGEDPLRRPADPP